MRRVMAALAMVALLTAAGCSGGGAGSAASPQDSSAPVVLGTSAATSGTAILPPEQGSGLAANSIPASAFPGNPGAKGIVVASGSPAISRARALEISAPAKGTGKDATLVSAVYVTLPVQFMRGVLNDPKKAKPTTAWVVTYANVLQRAHGGAYVAGQTTSAEAAQTRLGNTTVVIDATTGEQLLLSEYPSPK